MTTARGSLQAHRLGAWCAPGRALLRARCGLKQHASHEHGTGQPAGILLGSMARFRPMTRLGSTPAWR